MWQNELVSRFEKAGEIGEAGAVRVRVGERPHLHTVAIVVWDDEYENRSDNFHAVECSDIEIACERTAEILEESGFGSQFPNCRVDFLHAETGKPLRGWNSTTSIHGEMTEEGPMVEQVLAHALERNNAEMRRMFGMVCETLQMREDRIDRDRDEILELSRSEVLARAESEMTQILAEEAAQVDVEDPLKARAGEILGAIAQQFLGGSATPRDTVLQILRTDPELSAQLAGDPEVIALFTEALEAEPAPGAPLETENVAVNVDELTETGEGPGDSATQ